MDPLSSSSPIFIPDEKRQEINNAIKKRMKEHPEEYMVITSPKDQELRDFLKANPEKFSINEEGKIVIDEADLSPELLEAAKKNDLLIVTNYKTPPPLNAKPFGMK